MLIGLHTMAYETPDGPAGIAPRLRAQLAAAEEVGVHSFWPMDHFFQIGPSGVPVESPMLEAYTQLAWAAGVTTRMQLGALVTGVHHRHPGVLVKEVTTIDVLSGGRAWLGIGAGWNEEESKGLGIPMPTRSDRFVALEDTLRIAHQMFVGDESPFDGAYAQLARPLNSPAPVRRPPILVGGQGERKTLRLVAQYADACNLFDLHSEKAIGHKLDVLRRHCDEIGRPYDEIVRTVLTRLPTDDDAAEQMIERMEQVGIDLLLVGVTDIVDESVIDVLARLVVRAAGLGRPTPQVLLPA